MNLSTKYEPGQHVYCLTHSNVDMPPVRCSACEGERVVDVRGEKFPCPKCAGKGEIVHKASGWIVGDSGTVGHIRLTREQVTGMSHFDLWEDELPEGEWRTVEEYMISSTGIGSGTIWRDFNLFASREDAQAEADKRNHYVRTGERPARSYV